MNKFLLILIVLLLALIAWENRYDTSASLYGVYKTNRLTNKTFFIQRRSIPEKWQSKENELSLDEITNKLTERIIKEIEKLKR